MSEKESILRALESQADEGPRKWTTQELRLLATLKDSPYWPALQLVFAAERAKDAGPLLDERTDFAQTQFHRGRLSMLRDLVLLVSIEAPARLESDERREADKDPDA